MPFPGSIKGRANALSAFLTYFLSWTDRLSSSLILAAEQTNIQHEESTFNHGPFFLEETIPLLFIHSS